MAFKMPGKDEPVRLVSYLTTPLDNGSTAAVLGAIQEPFQAPSLVLRRLSHARDESTIFHVDSQSDRLGIRLYWAKDRSLFVAWSFAKMPCFLSNAPIQRSERSSILVVQQAKADPWFNLLDWQQQFAIDVAGNKSDDQTLILMWNRNGGDNQVWRFEPVKP